MPNFSHSGKKNPGDNISCNGGASPVALTDTLTVHGYTETVQEALRRGLVRVASVSGNTTVYQLQQNPDKFNQ